MTKSFSKYAILGLMAMSLVATIGCSKEEENTDNNPAPQEVNVADAVLSNYIKTYLNLGADQKITTENILGLDTLNMPGESNFTFATLEDLTGLEAAKNLVYIRIGGTMVTDLSPLAGLAKVEYFRINNTQITNLSALSNWSKLTYFNANTATSLTDISALSKNTNLQEMILRDVPMGNAGLNTISNFTKLYRLNARSTGITNIQPLVDMMAAGALLNTTPGASDNGGATLDLRGNTVDCTLLDPYRAQIANLEGC
jgi:hypothetical protein